MPGISHDHDRARLAVCIPVHHGRAEVMAELLAGLVPQIPKDGSVQICVSDNASRDSTPELVAALAQSLGSDLVSYHRHEVDRGLIENLLGVVELADAEYCWLVGSDDVPDADGVAQVLEFLAAHPGVSGLSVGATRRTGEGLTEQAPDIDIWPRVAGPAELEGVERIARECGLLNLILSTNVVHRDRWRAVVAGERDQIDRYPLIPHMYVIARMVAANPRWGWSGSSCLRSRQAAVFLDEDEHYRGDVLLQLKDQCVAMIGLWTRLYGRRSPLRRELIDRLCSLFWYPAAVGPTRLMGRRGARGFIDRLAVARVMWPSRTFRQRAMPLLLAPWRFVGLDRDPGPEPDRLQAALRASAAPVLEGGRGAWVEVEVENTGSTRIDYLRGSRPALFAAWRDGAGAPVETQIGHTPIFPGLRPGACRSIPVFVTVPIAEGPHELELAMFSVTGDWSAVTEPARVQVEIVSPGRLAVA